MEIGIVFQSILGRVSGGDHLTMPEMTQVMDFIMQGRAEEPEIALLLTALHAKGETVEEIAGAAAAMRKHMTPIRTKREKVVDTCGTGGGGTGTFNISTAAAIVAAATPEMGNAAVAKHGNRKITSKSGSADALEMLGVNIDAPVEVMENCLDELGVCFCFAPRLHSAMKHVAKVRRELDTPTIFNLLGPLCNPASAPYQILGVGRPELRELLAAALARLGVRRALVLCGEDGLGEISLRAPTRVTEVADGKLSEFVWRPEDFGRAPAEHSELLAEDPKASAAIIRRILSGDAGPPRDIVVMNAAAALWVVGVADPISQCARLVENAIDEGSAQRLLERLVEMTNAP